MSTASARVLPMFDSALLKPALVESLKRLSPRAQWRNPVMFVAWIWLTVWFANLAESLAEGRGKAQAAALRSAKQRVYAKQLQEPYYGSSWLPVPSDELMTGRAVLVEAGDIVPADGEVIEGVA